MCSEICYLTSRSIGNRSQERLRRVLAPLVLMSMAVTLYLGASVIAWSLGSLSKPILIQKLIVRHADRQ